MLTHIIMDLEHYKYVAVVDAANHCQPGCWLTKVDLKHAGLQRRWHTVRQLVSYRNVVVLQWVKHPPTSMISIFLLEPGSHRLTQMICCMMAQRGLYTALAHLDDVLIIEPTQTQCKAAFDTLLNLLVRVSQFHSQLDQSCLPCPMSDFSRSWNRHCQLWAPPLTELLSLLKGTSSEHKCT